MSKEDEILEELRRLRGVEEKRFKAEQEQRGFYCPNGSPHDFTYREILSPNGKHGTKVWCRNCGFQARDDERGYVYNPFPS